MGKFIKKFFVFCLIFIVSLILLEISLRSWHFINDSILNSSIAQFEIKSNKIKTLFIGNSKIYYAISSDSCFEKNNFHNFSFPSETIESTYWKLKYYSDNASLQNLKHVYIQLERAAIYATSPIERNNMYDYGKYYKHSFDEITKNSTFSFKLNEWITNNCVSYRLRPYLIDLILNQINYKIINKGKNTTNTNLFGAGMLFTKYNATKLKKDIHTLLIQENEYQKAALNISQITYYDLLIKLFEQKGIAVDFINIIEPIDIAAQDDVSINNLLIKNSEKEDTLIKKRYPNSKMIRLNKYSSLFKLEDFADNHHLNNTGSEKFSKLLSSVICQ